MGIHPGVLKQSHKSYLVLNKLHELNKLKYDFDFIQCDGGVTFDTIQDLTKLGINNLVCGSSTLFKDVVFDNEIQRFEKIDSNYKKVLDLSEL
jgi:pentose-5-phosphate-3-epimerase